MPASIGVNLRVTGHCRQGGRKYMEDFFSVAYQQTEDERDLEYAFFGIYDGHGGAEAAAFAKERLMETIVRHKYFWSDNDEDVLRSIKLGYIATHYAMWKEQEKWPKTASGLPSTAGTTASIAFIRRGKIYIGHVGDSAIVLGYQEPGCNTWKAKPLTRDHKPESAIEMSRIEQCGGKVISKSGVPRVVWNRPRIGHKGPVRRSTPIDEIPFLAVARSLGDLWSYNSELDEFVVSPDPDCSVIPIDTSTFRCLIFGTDGLYNMLNPQMAVHIVQQAEKHNEEAALSDAPNKIWLNPSKCLVEKALKLWSTTKMRADNTSVVTLMLDPPGPPRAQVLRNRKKSYPDSGLQIVTRYQNESSDPPKDVVESSEKPSKIPEHNPHILKSTTSYRTSSSEDKEKDDMERANVSCNPEYNKNFQLKPRESLSFDPNINSDDLKLSETTVVQNKTESKAVGVEVKSTKNSESKGHNLRNSDIKASDSNETINEPKAERCSNCKRTTSDTSEISTSSYEVSSNETPIFKKSEENIQINEISSSSNEFEDEESNTEDENFPKISFRKGRIRNPLRKVMNTINKIDTKPKQGKKRNLSESTDLLRTKKLKNSNTTDKETIKHNLRIRKISNSENGVKRNEEMVNQVDSTNKELKKRLSPRKKQNISNDAVTVTFKTGTNSNQNKFARRIVADKKNLRNLKSKDLTRKSQRLKQSERKRKSKQKIKERLKEKLTDTFNQKKSVKQVAKKILLLKNKSTKINKEVAETMSTKRNSRVSLSGRSSSGTKGTITKNKASKPKERKVLVSSKTRSERIKRNRTFKLEYLAKLRRHTSRNQKK